MFPRKASAFLLLFVSILFLTVALYFIPDPWSLKILEAQGALEWNEVYLWTGIGVFLVAVGVFMFYSVIVKTRL